MAEKLLAITIDTESDWFGSGRNEVRSINELGFVRDACAQYGMSATYLVTYEVVANDRARDIMRSIVKSGNCEIGHHLHVWSTPPFEKPNAYGVDENWIDGIQSELPDDIFAAKMRSLHEAIEEGLGIRPTSHRAGRWGIDKRTLDWLEANDYLVDSSVCPFNSYTATKGVRERVKTDTYSSPNRPYHPDGEDIASDGSLTGRAMRVLEVPVTGIKGDILSRLKIRGVGRVRHLLNRLGYNKTEDMSFRPSYWNLPFGIFERITHDLFGSDIPIVNFMFHSNELLMGGSPYSDSAERLKRIKEKILCVLKTAREHGARGVTLSGAASVFNRTAVSS